MVAPGGGQRSLDPEEPLHTLPRPGTLTSYLSLCVSEETLTKVEEGAPGHAGPFPGTQPVSLFFLDAARCSTRAFTHLAPATLAEDSTRSPSPEVPNLPAYQHHKGQ